jgi:2-oxoisovalerate dehydrogenase E1 component
VATAQARTSSGDTPGPPGVPPASDFSDDELVDLARKLLLPRLIEEKMLRLLRQGRLSKWFSGIGQEAIAVGVVAALGREDFVLPLHRNLGVFTTRGFDLDRLFRQLLGKGQGFTRGRDRTFHFGALDHHVVGMISHLGAMLPVADGLALAGALRHDSRVVAVFSGDGGTSEGDFHEALNLAAVWRLPVVFVVENNGWGLSTPTHEQFACADLAERGAGYGMPGVVVDGNDVLACYRAMREAVDRARAGDGPTLIEAKTYRLLPHTSDDDDRSYRTREEVERARALDPIGRFESYLAEQGVLDGDGRDAVRAEIVASIESDIGRAWAAPDPDPDALERHVFAEGDG